MNTEETTKEIVIAMIPRFHMTNILKPEEQTKIVTDAYKAIYKAVSESK